MEYEAKILSLIKFLASENLGTELVKNCRTFRISFIIEPAFLQNQLLPIIHQGIHQYFSTGKKLLDCYMLRLVSGYGNLIDGIRKNFTFA